MNTSMPPVKNGDIDQNAKTAASSIGPTRVSIVPPGHARTSAQLANRKSPDNEGNPSHPGHSLPPGA